MGPLWVVDPMLLAFGIEVRTGRFECRRIALRALMDVKGMFAGRQTPHIERNRDSASAVWRKRCCPDELTVRILQRNGG